MMMTSQIDLKEDIKSYERYNRAIAIEYSP